MSLTPKTRKIMLEGYRLPVDIGFHASEIGTPQMLELTVEVWREDRAWAVTDDKHHAWDYDFLRHDIARLAAARRVKSVAPQTAQMPSRAVGLNRAW